MTYVKCGIWHLDGRKKRQRTCHLLLLGKLVKPLLVPAAEAVCLKLLEKVSGKTFGGRKGRRKPIDDEEAMPRNNILLRGLATPKRVQWPKGPVFYANYQRVARNVLPKRVRRTYIRIISPRKQRKRKNQTGRGMPTQDLISTAIGLGTKASKSDLKKAIIKDTIYYVPTAYKKLTNKLKNKKARAVLDTEVGDYIVNRCIDLIGEPFD